MKFRIIITFLLCAVLAVCYFVSTDELNSGSTINSVEDYDGLKIN